MRMLLKAEIPTETGNHTIKNGVLPKTMMEFAEKWKPEGMYFATDNGHRCAFIFVDLPDAASIPAMCEPLFQNLGVKITIQPAMNGDDMRAGIERAMKHG